jgi:transcriptional regulator with XRE-family HTH domain
VLRLKFLRLSQDLRLYQLARKSGIGRTLLSNFESGRTNPRLAELQQLADALGYPHPDKLMDHVAAAELALGAESRDAYQDENGDGE